MRIDVLLVGVSLGGCGGEGGDRTDLSPIGDPPEEVTLTMDPFVIEPGAETFMCQNFANPFAGADVYIREFESHMTAGSHHLLANYLGNARSTGAAPCSGLELPAGPFATQTPDYVYTYQEGVAAPLLGSFGLRLNSHYLNTGREPLTAQVSVTLRRTPTETVVEEARTGVSFDASINVPPRETVTVTSGVKFREEAELLWLMPHMHMRGTHFLVKSTDGRTTNVVYETDDWEAPPHRFDQPVVMPAMWNLDYSCTFVNTTETTLTFGESALNNEMCVLIYQHTANKSGR
jgi:hypothetical protein